MGKVVKAEYDAEHQTLRLLEPIEGFDDHEKVSVIVEKVVAERPWMALADTLVGEDGERFERAIEEAFPIEK
ncbi:MAG: hypothetical protein AABO58_11245 [Acidobacteriota bacterium]